jgi:hypothetical protein
VLVAPGLEARRERVTEREVHASRRRRGVPNGRLPLHGRGKREPQNEEQGSHECDQRATRCTCASHHDLLSVVDEPNVATASMRYIDESPRSGTGFSLMTAGTEGVSMSRAGTWIAAWKGET